MTNQNTKTLIIEREEIFANDNKSSNFNENDHVETNNNHIETKNDHFENNNEHIENNKRISKEKKVKKYVEKNFSEI